MNELALFSGAGGGILGGSLLGWRTVAAVEVEDYPRRVLLQRQADGLLPRFPIWDDIRTFDGTPWRGRVDVISGGFPCQDISAAGSGKGISGERSGLWSEMSRVISEVRPKHAFIENSSNLLVRGGTRVIEDLTEMGYDCRWGVISASDIGANHVRKRIWIVAYPQRMGWQKGTSVRGESTNQESSDQSDNGNQDERTGDISNTDGIRQQRQGEYEQPINSKKSSNRKANILEPISISDQWLTEPRLGRVAHGVAHRVDRLKAIGNGQVPLCAATAWRILTKGIL